MGSTHRGTWVLVLLAIPPLLLTGGTAQASDGGPWAGERISGSSPAAERAGAKTYQLDGDQLSPAGGTVRLFVHVKKNRKGKFVPTYIGAMFAFGHTVECDEGTYPATRIFGTQSDIKVDSKGKFHYNLKGLVANFAGKITKQGKAAAGTVSYGPNDIFDEDSGLTYHNCALPNPVKYVASFTKVS